MSEYKIDDYLNGLVLQVKNGSKNIVLLKEKIDAYLVDSLPEDMAALFKYVLDMEVSKIPLKLNNVLENILEKYGNDKDFIKEFNDEFFYKKMFSFEEKDDSLEIKINYNVLYALSSLTMIKSGPKDFFKAIEEGSAKDFLFSYNSTSFLFSFSYMELNDTTTIYPLAMEVENHINGFLDHLLEENESLIKSKNENNVVFINVSIPKNNIPKDIPVNDFIEYFKRIVYVKNDDFKCWTGIQIQKRLMEKDLVESKINGLAPVIELKPKTRKF